MKHKHVAVACTAVVIGIAGNVPAHALDHFACYTSRVTAGTAQLPGVSDPPGVALVDRFGSSVVAVRKSKYLCAPTDKLGEDPDAPTHGEHLKAYQIKIHSRAQPTLPTAFTVFDQFNVAGLTVDGVKRSHLLVPSAKSLSGPPPTPAAFSVDHFECYKIRVTARTPQFARRTGVTLDDQFGSLTTTVIKPQFLCMPADKNGETPGAETHAGLLTCYRAKETGLLRFAKRGGVFVHDQFGLETLDVKKLSQLCVPALQAAPPTPSATATPSPTTTVTPSGSCGDGIRNTLDEECDGADDAACPAQCGVPAGPFPCLCTNIPRQRVIEHADADLDNGWTGINHDAGIVEGGGYVVDLYDCDGTNDTVCTVGPSCELPFFGVNPPCDSDTQCQAFGLGQCRKRRTAVGPHCHLDIQQFCTADANCSGAGNFCEKHLHGAPLPLSAGGVSVCVVNIFSENVTGTSDVASGAGAVRLRQRSVVYIGPTLDQPCPVCGGFCAGSAGDASGPGTRTTCTTDADCPNPPNVCVTDPICSYGDNVDQACRPDPPLGGPTELFGNPSVDCLPKTAANISGPGLDILFNPATTGSLVLPPSVECPADGSHTLGFDGQRCVGGSNEGRTCVTPSECPGGTCNEQCFCPNGASKCIGGPSVGRTCCLQGACVNGVCSGGANDGGLCQTNDCGTGSCELTDGMPQRPNPCNPACVGGANDMNLCSSDTSCPGGFCQIASCRLNSNDGDSCGEGFCPAGPTRGSCAVHSFKSCARNADCQGASCPSCDPGETCAFKRSECFVNSGIERCGSPGVPDKVSAAIFCIPATHRPAIDSAAGLPGPGALTQPITTIETGF